PNVVGGAVSFNVDKLEPEYALQIPGVGASYAIALTEKMGLDPRVVDRAKDFVGKRFRILELEIPALERQKRKLEADMAMAEGKWEAMARKERHHLALMLAMQRFTLGLLAEAADQATDLVKDARRTVARLVQQSKAAASVAEVQQVAESEVQKLSQVRQGLDQQARGLKRASKPTPTVGGGGGKSTAAPEPEPAAIGIGSRVWIPLLKREGEVLALRKGGTVAEVTLDGKRMTLDVARLEAVSGGAAVATKEKPKTSFDVERPTDVPLWLDLHGIRVQEGLEKVEEFLQAAYLARRGSVQLVHGIGTGKLRSAIWKYLKHHPLVKYVREADPSEGGLGVTIVTFRD
ncbi:MAG TPA: Smr/MutS family protein, partial [bacterium]|nr:Smr/MutS family protein [bacterium]